jgi:hypothetical protein
VTLAGPVVVVPRAAAEELAKEAVHGERRGG